MAKGSKATQKKRGRAVKHTIWGGRWLEGALKGKKVGLENELPER
jgi:hypothetical protein